jgi:hypothetical protein
MISNWFMDHEAKRPTFYAMTGGLILHISSAKKLEHFLHEILEVSLLAESDRNRATCPLPARRISAAKWQARPTMSRLFLLRPTARSAFHQGQELRAPTKAEYIAQTILSLSFFACDKAADHTFRLS